jgi:hypothetical protein
MTSGLFSVHAPFARSMTIGLEVMSRLVVLVFETSLASWYKRIEIRKSAFTNDAIVSVVEFPSLLVATDAFTLFLGWCTFVGALGVVA